MRVVFHVTFVQAERKLVNVAAEMLRAGVVIDADQAALQNGEDAFNAVRRDIVADIFAVAVIDGFVREAARSARRRSNSSVWIVAPSSTCRQSPCEP